METSANLKGIVLEAFLTSVLSQMATLEDKEIYFGSQIQTSHLSSLFNGSAPFDVIAPNGFNGISGPVIFEFKFSQKNFNHSRLLALLNSLYKRAALLPYDAVTLIVVTNSIIDLSETIDDYIIKAPHPKKFSVEIWDSRKLDKLIELYPLDFSNAQSARNSTAHIQSSESPNITETDFEEKSKNNLYAIKNIAKKKTNFALVLGAGVSIDPGAKSWNALLANFTNELKKAGIIDDEKSLSQKIGGSSIITAQFCKDLYPNDSDYYWAIHQGLYENRKPINKTYSIYHIARIAQLNVDTPHFRILTYNYDDYLETYLNKLRVNFNILFDSQCTVNRSLSIYHVHGFLPEVQFKTHIQKRYQKSIYLTEEDYNELYNQPYSWQISSQLSFFRENICLFVGCSLADPNIRRLLEMTKKEARTHYAILSKDNMTITDLTKVSNHFSRLGIEVIWVSDYSKISDCLRALY